MKHRKLIKSMARRGWDYTTTKRGHLRFRHIASGAIVICSSSPSDPRAMKNFWADVKRCERGELGRGAGLPPQWGG